MAISTGKGPAGPTYPTTGNFKGEKVTDEQLVNLIESGVQNSIGDWLNSSDLTRERLKSTLEYAGVPQDHLAPQGVSTIVDTSTTEVIEAYTAVLTDLFLNNGKVARFTPYDDTPGAYDAARKASMVTNYCIFKKNNGWEILQSWMKSALLWKNGIVRWDYIEDFDYNIEEYAEISQERLDELLADESVEIVGDLEYENKVNGEENELVYVNVRLRRKINKSRVKLENVPPENFRISRDATRINDASFVGIQVDMTRSEIRKQWPDVAESIKDWDVLGQDEQWLGNARYSEDIATRKQVTGQEYWQGSVAQDLFPVEANREITVTECWINVDRDGDGIAELKHFIIASQQILFEEDVEDVPLASLSPIDIPHEFYGLSMADFTRSSTLASTAILRGFVENTYLTNYSPKLADPNTVDFSALQNMKPKQIIPTNGNPATAVAPLPPEAISTGTVPLLEHLQLIKEQATGMSKAAQGLNDTLYVSGNSEEKMQSVQSASQKRIQHIARRFAETGFKRMIEGVYKTMRTHMNTNMMIYKNGVYASINPSTLPLHLDVEIMLDIGENSNSSQIQKLQALGGQILPGLNEAGAGMTIRPEAPAVLATKLIEAMNLDSNDFLEDYTTDEFKDKAAKAIEEQTQEQQKRKALEDRK
ncbi:MAG: portal protein, partial [Bdellovibrionales bacterium]